MSVAKTAWGELHTEDTQAYGIVQIPNSNMSNTVIPLLVF